MDKPEFNLLDEKWIRVLTADCGTQEVSLLDALLHARDYVDLSGELPAQDVTILRLLLAVVYTVFTRVDQRGEASPLWEQKTGEAKARWKALWELGRFPEAPIRDYLEHWRERFWLFHPERPFYQIAEAAGGTEYTAAKLNGEMSESNNKLRLFPGASGEGKQKLAYGEAARWLLYVNGVDDTASKARGKGLPSPGAGWLGKLGLIYNVGRNLFETILLNLTLLRDGKSAWGAEPCPVWELEVPRSAERTEIPVPEDPAALWTLQSRRLLLNREDNAVTGYALLGGDFFPKSNAIFEQMTIWKTGQAKSGQPPEYLPRRHDPTRQFWRDFGAVFMPEADSRQPGVVKWYETLAVYMGWPPATLARFRIVSVQYGDKDFFINDVFSDSLAFHAALLSEMGEAWRERVAEEVDRCEQLAYAVGELEVSLAKAAGGDAKPNDAKAQFYARVDQPFRRWLRSIDPETVEEAAREKLEEWQREAKRITGQLGEELVQSAGAVAFSGRFIKEKTKGKELARHYAAPEAYNRFTWRIHQIYKEG